MEILLSNLTKRFTGASRALNYGMIDSVTLYPNWDMYGTILFETYLITRVTRATEGDFVKLSKCLRYLRRAKELVLTITANDDTNLVEASNASYEVHEDGKLDAGVSLMRGGALVANNISILSPVAKRS